MSEQFRFQEVFRNRAAINRDEIPGHHRHFVDQSRNQLLAGSALSGHQHGRRVRRHAFGQRDGVPHPGAAGDDSTMSLLDLDFPPQSTDLAILLRALFRDLDAQNQGIGRKRFVNVVPGTLANCLHGLVLAPVGRHHDHQCGAAGLPQPVQELESVHSRHPDVGEDQVGIPFNGLLQALIAVRGGLYRVLFVLQQERYGPSQTGIIINDQDFHLASFRSATGNRTLRTAPAPSAGTASIAPPIPSIRRAETARPRPVPRPGSFVVKNGSNTRPRRLSGIPGPSSRTTSSTATSPCCSWRAGPGSSLRSSRLT